MISEQLRNLYNIDMIDKNLKKIIINIIQYMTKCKYMTN